MIAPYFMPPLGCTWNKLIRVNNHDFHTLERGTHRDCNYFVTNDDILLLAQASAGCGSAEERGSGSRIKPPALRSESPALPHRRVSGFRRAFTVRVGSE